MDDAPPAGRLGTAHPHHDRASGERFRYEVDLAPPTGYRVLVEKNGRERVLATIPRERPSYLHSFALTRRHVVLLEQPFAIDPASFFTGPPRAIVEHYGWDRSLGSRALVVDRHAGGLVAEIEFEPLFAFHHVNAFEAQGELHLDVCAYSDSRIIDGLALKKLRAAEQALPRVRPTRVSLDVGRRTARVRRQADIDFELPRTADTVARRDYRYAYGIGVSPHARFSDQLVKLDHVRENHRIWRDPGCYPGEPVFVPHPRARREDDGVLLSVVLDAGRRASFLLVLDAQTMSERARASVPHHIPFGFHGLHVPA